MRRARPRQELLLGGRFVKLATMLLYRWPLALLFGFLLGLSIMLCNVVQVLSLVFAPVSPWLTKQINRGVCFFWFGFLAFTLRVILRIEIRVSGDSLSRGENIFLVANHQAMADIPVIVSIAARYLRHQDLKWFVKDPLKWVPGIGWGMKFLDCIFVKRNWIADRQHVLATFARLRESPLPFWVVSFLEGTRMRPHKLAKSQAYATRQGLPPLQHLMLPRTKGFEATLRGLEGRVAAVVDVTIGYEGAAPSLADLFLRVRRVHVHLRRFPVTELPPDDGGRGAWVNERFREKDQLLAGFYRNGQF
jgi:1-acyl-sn-glycerol-3-phosphate acyltransferase